MQSNSNVILPSNNKLKRLCYVVTSFPQVSETFIVEEALSLKDFGVDFCIYALRKGNYNLVHPSAQTLIEQNKVFFTEKISKLQSLNALIFLILNKPINTLRVLIKAIRHPIRWRYFQTLPYASYLLKTHTDYIHAHFADDNLCYAAILSEWTGIPYGFTAHRYDILDDPLTIEEFTSLANQASAIVVVSNYFKSLVKSKYSLNDEQIYVAFNGIRLELFKPQHKSQHKSQQNDALRLLNVGRLVPIKGQDILLSAMAKLIDQGFNIQLRIIGEGSSRDDLEALIKRLALHEHVELLGAKSQQEVLQHMAETDIFVMPSRSESFGVACIEAMAMELPVIASNAEGLPEVVEHQKTGLLFSSENIDELTDTIAWMIKHPDKRLGMGLKGRERVLANFSREKVTSGLLNYLNNSI